jgi:type II secretory pathway pseudopilin PulG
LSSKPLRCGFRFRPVETAHTLSATLAALLFPAIGGMQERGKATQDLNNLRQIGLATQMYLNDNDAAFFSPADVWMQDLVPKYLGSWRIFKSPFDNRVLSETPATAPVSYGFSADIKATPQGNATASSLAADQIANPAVCILLAPAQDKSSVTKFTGLGAAAVTVDRAGGGSQGAAQGGTHSSRKRINACMADLHVETMSWGTVGVSGYVNDQHTPSDQSGNQRWDPTATPAPTQ